MRLWTTPRLRLDVITFRTREYRLFDAEVSSSIFLRTDPRNENKPHKNLECRVKSQPVRLNSKAECLKSCLLAAVLHSSRLLDEWSALMATNNNLQVSWGPALGLAKTGKYADKVVHLQD